MTYNLEFVEPALKEWKKLNLSVQQQSKKKLVQILQHPEIPKNRLSGHSNRYNI